MLLLSSRSLSNFFYLPENQNGGSRWKNDQIANRKKLIVLPWLFPSKPFLLLLFYLIVGYCWTGEI
jgi:hypothetical protein